MRILRQDAAFQGVTLFPGHGADVEGIGGLLVGGLLQLASVDQLDVTDRRSSSLRWLAGLDPGPPLLDTTGDVATAIVWPPFSTCRPVWVPQPVVTASATSASARLMPAAQEARS